MDALTKNLNLIANFLFIGGLLLVAFPFLAISVYNHPSDDDFSCSILNQPIGLTDYVQQWYQGHTGRYTAILLWYYPNPMNYDSWMIGVKIAPIVFLLLLYIAIYVTLLSLLKPVLNKNESAVAALVLYTLYLFATPLIASAFYWFMGASVYTSGSVLFLLATGALVTFFRSEERGAKLLYFLVATLLIIATIGCNESILSVFLVLLFLTLLRNILSKDRKVWLYAYFFTVGLVSALVSLLAPGNKTRAKGVYEGAYDSILTVSTLIKYVVKSLYFGATHLAAWTNSGVLWLFSLLFIPIALTLARKNSLVKKYLCFHPLIYIFLLWLVMSASAFIPFVGTGDALDRVWNSTYLFFLLGWFITVQALVNHYADWFAKLYALIKGYPVSLIKVVTIFLLFAVQPNNINTSIIDYLTKAPGYDQEMKVRYQQLYMARAQHQTHCEIKPLFEKPYKCPKTLFLSDITPDPAFWLNKNYSNFFGVDSVYTSGSAIITRHEEHY